LGNKIEFLAP